MGYLYFNFQYLLFMLPAVALSFIAQIMVKSTFSRYSRVMNRRGMTGAMAAEQVLWANHVPGIQFRHISGNLSDHFDPRSRTIALSDGVYNPGYHRGRWAWPLTRPATLCSMSRAIGPSGCAAPWCR